MAKVKITYRNGSQSERDYPSFVEAIEYCQRGISYSGERIARVEVDARAVWDHTWDVISQHAGLYR